MNKKSALLTVSKRLAETLAIALAYIAAAKLGFLVAIPPGNVTPVWPPSGLALAAALVLGYRSGLGIWLGSFSANAWFFTQTIALSAATVVSASSIATGSTLQALFVAFLIKRVVGTTRPERLFDVVKFLGIAAVSCLIASFWGVTTLVLAGLVSLGNYPYTWFTWWLGDLAGILVIAPPLLVLSQKKLSHNFMAQMAFPLVGFGSGLTLIVFFSLWHSMTHSLWPWGFLLAGLSFTALLSAYIEARKRAEASLREAQARLRLALQASNTGLWDWNLKTNEVYFSPEWKHQLGYEDHEVPDSYEEWESRLHPEDRDRALATVRAYLEGRIPEYELEHRLRHKDGSYRWALSRGVSVRNATGRPYRMAGSHVDITERKEAEEALVESERRFRTFVNSTPAMLWMTDVNGRCVLFNEAWLAFTGKNLDEELAHEWTGKEVHPDDLEACFTTYWRSFQAHTAFEHEYRLQRKDGEYRWLSEVGIPRFDAMGRYEGFIGTVIDITERKEAENQLAQLALYDRLTGLANRHWLEEELERALIAARRYKQKIAVMFIDLDRFKNVNDTLGHEAGDCLLKQVAERLRTQVRESDVVARLGGDEFVIVLINIARPEDVAQVARKILKALSAPVDLGGNEIVLSASIGISLSPEDGSDVKTLLRHADAALYYAKEGGKNDYRFHTASLSARAHHRLTVESGLRRALDRHEFLLEYQPVVAHGGLISAAEALLRWRHPKQGVISPAEFISVAEESGLIIPIGEWVLQAVCAQLQAWQRAGYGRLRVALNLSPRQLRQPKFITTLQDILSTTGNQPPCLELEVTESTLMVNTPAVLEVLQGLKELGITLAIDDFGTGYASLAYLKRFPIDGLKIDRSFVQDITTDPSDRAIVKAIIAMARSLDLRVVAEGVETKEQLSLIREYGCHEYQGYFFSPAVEADVFARLMPRVSPQKPAAQGT